MRRSLTGWLVTAVLLSSLLAFAKDSPPPPPPPPPPPAEEAPPPSSSGGSSSLNGTDGLFDASNKTRKSMLSFFVGLPYGGYSGYGYYGGFPIGLGARFYLPIVPNGFIPSLNDSFGLEFGVDASFYLGGFGGTGIGLGIPIEARWGFHLIPKLEVYGKVGFALGFFVVPNYGVAFWPYAVAQAGVVYQITETIALRAEVGYPNIKVGIGIAL